MTETILCAHCIAADTASGFEAPGVQIKTKANGAFEHEKHEVIVLQITLTTAIVVCMLIKINNIKTALALQNTRQLYSEAIKNCHQQPAKTVPGHPPLRPSKTRRACSIRNNLDARAGGCVNGKWHIVS